METVQLSTAEMIADPYPVYRELRDQSPLNCAWLPAGALPGVEKPIRAWALCGMTTCTAHCGITLRFRRRAAPCCAKPSHLSRCLRTTHHATHGYAAWSTRHLPSNAS